MPHNLERDEFESMMTKMDTLNQSVSAAQSLISSNSDRFKKLTQFIDDFEEETHPVFSSENEHDRAHYAKQILD